MTSELSAITAGFSGSEWQQAIAEPIRQSEIERTRAVRLLHDQVGQILSAVGLHLGILARESPQLAEIQTMLESGMAHVREISLELNPSAVEHAGLRFALEHLIREQQPHFPGGATLDFAKDSRVPSLVSRVLFPIARQGVEFARESGANQVDVRVEKGTSGWILELIYDVSSPDSTKLKASERLSLVLLHYQAIRAGLPIVFDNAPEGRTLVRAVYPSS